VRDIKHLLLAVAIASLTACRSARSPGTPPPTPGLSTPPAVAQAAPTDTPVPTLLGIDWDDRSAFSSGLLAAEQGVLQQLRGATVYHIDLRISDDLLRLEGEQQVRYVNQELEALHDVYFRLYPNLFGAAMEVSSVRLNGEAVSPAHELADSAMRVPLSPSLPAGAAAVFDIAFSLQVPLSGEGNYGIFGLVDDVLALAHCYPVIPVYDDEGWNVEIPPEFGDVLYADSSFYLVRVSAPGELTIVASGTEIERQQIDGRQRVTLAGGPMRDFYIAASNAYTKVSRQVGGTMVNSYASAKLAAGAEMALQHTVDALRIFNARFGTYPFAEFDVVATPTLALGVEYPGIVAMAQRLYPPQTEYSPAYLESTMAHEVSHQWFYSMIGNDQLDEPWLDEALAQYATLVYFRDLYGTTGADGFRSSLYGRWDRVDRAATPVGMSVHAYTAREYGAIVYGRGPLFVEALSAHMGEETFASFLREYNEAFKWSIATAEGFKQLAESHCQCDLTMLFEEWVDPHR
jgi:hypothetical protein